MGSNPLHYDSIAQTTANIASGALSSVEVVRHTLERIETLEPALHAFAEVRSKAALEEALAADLKQAAGKPLGLLHGVPLAVKDLCSMAGTGTRAGGRFDTGYGATDTATVVARLQASGAIIIGKTQLTEGAWGAHHPDNTAPVNPWAHDQWTGVSSSGSGVSVAAGMAFGAIGTDTAGSIRFPSACCHLVGLKPGWGRVSRHGVFPLADTFDHIGPMTRTVLDAALMFTAIAGPDKLDPTALGPGADDWVLAAKTGTLQGVRIGIDPDYSLANLDAATLDALQKAIATMEAAGAVIVRVRLPPVQAILETAMLALFAEAAIAHAANYPANKSCYSEAFAEILDIGHRASAIDCARVAIWRREFSGQLHALFKSVDMLAAPVIPMVPPTAADMRAMESGSPLAAAPLLGFTLPFNLAGVPCLTLPTALLNDRVPLAMQLIEPRAVRSDAAVGRSGIRDRLRFRKPPPGHLTSDQSIWVLSLFR